MGLLDDIKKGADKLATGINDGISGSSSDAPSAKQAEPLLRDLGCLAFLDVLGRGTETQAEDLDRVIGELRALEDQGLVLDLALRSGAPPPPSSATPTPPPSSGGVTPPPPPGGVTPPPPPGSATPTEPPPQSPEPPPPPAAAPVPPPPPSGGTVSPPPPPAGGAVRAPEDPPGS